MDTFEQVMAAARAGQITVDEDLVRQAIAANFSVTDIIGALTTTWGSQEGLQRLVATRVPQGEPFSPLLSALDPRAASRLTSPAPTTTTTQTVEGGGRPYSSAAVAGQGFDSSQAIPSTSGGSDLIKRLKATFGLDDKEAQDIIVNEGVAGALSLLAKGAGGKGAEGRTQFESERALQEAQAESLRSGAANDQQRLELDRAQGLQDLSVKLRQLGLSEQAQKAEDAARQIGLQLQERGLGIQQQGEERQGREGRLSALLGVGRLGLDTQTAQNEQQARMAEIGLKREEATREILSRPSDVLARLFFQRGGTSPVPMVTQADLINRLASTMPNPAPINNPMGQYQGLLDELLRPPAVEARPLLSPTAPATAPSTTGLLTSGTVPGAVNPEQYRAPGWTPQPEWQPTPGFPTNAQLQGMEHGGTTQEPMMLVGEKGPEMVMNPRLSPIGVVDAKKTKKMLKGGAEVPGYALGTLTPSLPPVGTQSTPPLDAMWTTNTSPAPAPGTISSNVSPEQRRLIGLAREATAPGPAAVLGGTRAPRLNIPGLQLPSYQAFSRLTGDERESLRPRLGTEFQTTLEDLMDMIQQRYGGTRTRSAARLGMR